MKINKIPLNERLERLKNGYASDPEYNVSLLRKFAGIPLKEYLEGFLGKTGLTRLSIVLRLTREETAELTYGKAAAMAGRMEKGSQQRCAVAEILAAPFLRCYEAGKENYERNKQETA